MAYLDTYTTPLTAATAAHLLRRATFGPTQQEIAGFTGKTASQAVDLLISNAANRATPPPPVEMDPTRSDAGQPFLGKGFSADRNGMYFNYIRYWWLGLMTEKNGSPSILEKLTAFWQNHFVVTYAAVEDYRFLDRYLRLLRTNSLKNFRELVIGVTKDAGMLIFQNGNENTKEQPNENYGRELQELFTVGQRDFRGNHNYTEQDVKAAAQVLTGWQVPKRMREGSFDVYFNPDRHETSNKVFSAKYSNTVIQGKSGANAGDEEIGDLTNMLLRHPECPKFICRKLYRWYVNPDVTQEIEESMIVPLASFFSSSSNNYEIAPVVKKLLTCDEFYNPRNFGAIIKSPAELLIGTIRYYSFPIPDLNDFQSFYNMMSWLNNSLTILQLNLLNQPSVFGSPAYYQTGYSKNWINETTLGQRGAKTDDIVNGSLLVNANYRMSVDILSMLSKIQPNFSDVNGAAAISAEQVLDELSRNLFVFELSIEQKNFLIDSIMMMNSSPRSTWIREWNAYRSAPNDVVKQNTILWRCRALLKYMLRMAEYQIF